MSEELDIKPIIESFKRGRYHEVIKAVRTACRGSEGKLFEPPMHNLLQLYIKALFNQSFQGRGDGLDAFLNKAFLFAEQFLARFNDLTLAHTTSAWLYKRLAAKNKEKKPPQYGEVFKNLDKSTGYLEAAIQREPASVATRCSLAENKAFEASCYILIDNMEKAEEAAVIALQHAERAEEMLAATVLTAEAATQQGYMVDAVLGYAQATLGVIEIINEKMADALSDDMFAEGMELLLATAKIGSRDAATNIFSIYELLLVKKAQCQPLFHEHTRSLLGAGAKFEGDAAMVRKYDDVCSKSGTKADIAILKSAPEVLHATTRR